MKSLMMDFPLTLSHIFERSSRLFPKKAIVTRLPGTMHGYTYADFAERTRRLAQVLRDLGVKPGDRIGTFAWNTFRHLELYWAVPCLGAVLHTVNIRLSLCGLKPLANHRAASRKPAVGPPDCPDDGSTGRLDGGGRSRL